MSIPETRASEPGAARVWLAALAAPAAWLAAFIASLMLMRGGCSEGAFVARYAVLALAGALGLAALILALRYRDALKEATVSSDGGMRRLAVVFGSLLGGASLVLVALLAFSSLYLDPCLHGSLPLGGGR
jgi:hypothetical protein